MEELRRKEEKRERGVDEKSLRCSPEHLAMPQRCSGPCSLAPFLLGTTIEYPIDVNNS